MMQAMDKNRDIVYEMKRRKVMISPLAEPCHGYLEGAIAGFGVHIHKVRFPGECVGKQTN